MNLDFNNLCLTGLKEDELCKLKPDTLMELNKHINLQNEFLDLLVKLKRIQMNLVEKIKNELKE